MQEVALEYEQIEKKIVHHKNGVVSSDMQAYGIDYKLNYGLSIPEINKIAAKYPKNNSLALFCWQQEMREAKLIAIRLFDPAQISDQILKEIISSISNIELAEQVSFVLLGNLPDNLALSKELIKNGNEFVIYMGLLTILRATKTRKVVDEVIYTELLDRLIQIQWTQKTFILRALSGVLVQIGIKNKYLEQKVLLWINNNKFENRNITQYLKQEVMNFLGTKN